MTPLPAALGGAELVAWRLDDARFGAAWDRGEGAYRAGGRWNSKGIRAVYCALDPATAILEIAVHKGFRALDAIPHLLTALTVADPAGVHLVDPSSVPDRDWLRPGVPGAGQQEFGDRLLAHHPFACIPSTVSTHSWNLIFLAGTAGYSVRSQEPFVLDPRLHASSLSHP